MNDRVTIQIDNGVADVGQMIDLCPGRDLGFFDLNKVTNMGLRS